MTIPDDKTERARGPSDAELAAEAVCHDEQLEIWVDEFVEHLHAAASDFLPDFETYGIKIMYFAAIKAAIKDVVEKAFSHPELKKLEARSEISEAMAIRAFQVFDQHHGNAIEAMRAALAAALNGEGK
jgi:hypothetical protein